MGKHNVIGILYDSRGMWGTLNQKKYSNSIFAVISTEHCGFHSFEAKSFKYKVS
jgi:hypothetical protein